MDKSELKRVLHNQFEPLERAAMSKLSYLQSDDVFSADSYSAYAELDSFGSDDSLENAFNETLSPPTPPMYQAPAPEEIQHIKQAPQPSYAGATPSPDSIATHKQNMAAKIAALRGISMPGDYLRTKK